MRRALMMFLVVSVAVAVSLTGLASAEVLPTDPENGVDLGPSTAAASGEPSGFGMVTPARLMDTRPGRTTVDGEASGAGAFRNTRELKVTGRGGVPSSRVGAVVVNVTITAPVGGGYTSVFPAGESRPTASNVNYVAGQTVANLVVAKVGDDGQISVFNSTTAHVIVDVSGWYAEGDVFSSLTPARLLDTRPGRQTVDRKLEGWGRLSGVIPFALVGRGGIPPSGVGAVLLNVTITDPVSEGYATVFPTGATFANGGYVPTASNINYRKGQTVAGLVVAKLGMDGQISIYNSTSSHVVIDVAGWYPETSDFDPLDPARLMETRPGVPTVGNWGTVDGSAAGGGAFKNTRKLKVTGRGGVPRDDVGAVVVNVTVTAPAGEGYTTVFPSDSPRPTASTLNFRKGQTVANLAVVPVDGAGQISVFNSVGAHTIIDVAGWYPAGTAAVGVAKQVSTGVTHSCVTTTANTAKCWGNNRWTQLLDGSQVERTRPMTVIDLEPGIASLDSGNGYGCAVTTAGAAKCWGIGYMGTVFDDFTYTRVTAISGLESGVASISAGYWHACAVTTGGAAKCWGDNSSGQLGNGTLITGDKAVPVDVFGLGSGVRSIAAGRYHTCAVMTSGEAKCWGKAGSGQLGDGQASGQHEVTKPVTVIGLESGVESITVGNSHSCALMTSGEVKCWGENNGRLGDGSDLGSGPVTVVGLEPGVKSLDAGYNHTCAVTVDGAAKCWGGNGDGTLGDGTTTTAFAPVTVLGLGSGVSSISAGDQHSCAVLNTGGVRCWGLNYDGRLGDRTRTARLTPVAVSGFE